MDKKQLERKRNFWMKIIILLIFVMFLGNEAPIKFLAGWTVAFFSAVFMASRREWQIIRLDEETNRNYSKRVWNREKGEYYTEPSHHSGVR